MNVTFNISVKLNVHNVEYTCHSGSPKLNKFGAISPERVHGLCFITEGTVFGIYQDMLPQWIKSQLTEKITFPKKIAILLTSTMKTAST